MTIDSATILVFIDKFGLSSAYLAGIFYLGYRVITGPMMVLAKAGAEYLQSATASLNRTHLEHVEIKGHVTAEATAVREHVTDEVKGLHARVEAVETRLESEVRSVSGQHLVLPVPAGSRPSLPTLPEQGQRSSIT